MTLISILIVLLLEKYADWQTKLRNANWCCSYESWMRAKLSEYKGLDGPAGLILIIAPVIIIVGVISTILNGYHSFYSFIFGILVLSYSIGPKKIHEDVQKFIHSKKQGDNEGAYWQLDNILGQDIPESEPLLTLKLIKVILIQTSRQLLSILFWFVVLGPIGAALFRLVSIIHEDKLKNKDDSQFAIAAAQLQHILHWIPSRLTALSYAISGSFAHSLDCWRNTPDVYSSTDTFIDKNDDMLTCIGLSALQLGTTEQDDNNPDLDRQNLKLNSVNEALKLGLRAIIVWVTVLAIMTLAGWMS
ncbi:MAG: regulatory signaling modulator protein AmpE [Gammaproteobacteria bacterium]|nr:regulatory signaling modulator protein AmpE [Gammaproteobacteria bacterium]